MKIEYITVGSGYQIFIPEEIRKKLKGWAGRAKVSIHARDEETIEIKMLRIRK